MEDYYNKDDAPTLAHHGIKGMHWGIRRFQNYDGTRIKGASEATKKRISDAVESVKKKRQQAHTAKIEKIKNSGDGKKILKIQNELTNEEINAAITRIDAQNRLKTKVSETDRSESLKQIEKLSKTLGTLSTFMNNASSSIDNFKKLVKSIEGKKDKDKDDNKDAKKKEVLKNFFDTGDAEVLKKNASEFTVDELGKMENLIKSHNTLTNPSEVGKKNEDERRAENASKKAEIVNNYFNTGDKSVLSKNISLFSIDEIGKMTNLINGRKTLIDDDSDDEKEKKKKD